MEEQEGKQPEGKQPESQEPDTGEQRADEAELMARLQEEIRNLPVGEHLVYMMQSLSGLAVARMGLTADSESRRDMEQARLAIDAFKALLDLLERARPGAEMAAHRGMLSQLQLAYVGALDAGAAAGTEPQEAPEDAGAQPQEAPEDAGAAETAAADAEVAGDAAATEEGRTAEDAQGA